MPSNVVKLPDGSLVGVTAENKASVYDLFLQSGRYNDSYSQRALAGALDSASQGSSPANTDFFSWWTVVKNTALGTASKLQEIPGAIIKPTVDTAKWVSIGLLAVAVITIVYVVRK